MLEQHRPVEQFDVDPAILDGLGRIGDLDQVARRGLRIGVGTVGGEFHGRIESGCDLAPSKAASCVSTDPKVGASVSFTRLRY
jgi:hypothetical protein